MKWIATKLGLSASFGAGKSCPWCEVDMSELSSLEPATPRTVNRLRMASHLPPMTDAGEPVYPFCCPHCGIEFKSQAAWAAEKLTDSSAKSFHLRHAGSQWHRPPISNTEPNMFILCVLHMRLSFSNSLWAYCIKPAVRTSETAARINALLQKDGINVRRVKAIKGLSDLESIQQTRFTGNPADKFMAKFDTYLEVGQVNDKQKWFD